MFYNEWENSCPTLGIKALQNYECFGSAYLWTEKWSNVYEIRFLQFFLLEAAKRIWVNHFTLLNFPQQWNFWKYIWMFWLLNWKWKSRKVRTRKFKKKRIRRTRQKRKESGRISNDIWVPFLLGHCF